MKLTTLTIELALSKSDIKRLIALELNGNTVINPHKESWGKAYQELPRDMEDPIWDKQYKRVMAIEDKLDRYKWWIWAMESMGIFGVYIDWSCQETNFSLTTAGKQIISSLKTAT